MIFRVKDFPESIRQRNYLEIIVLLQDFHAMTKGISYFSVAVIILMVSSCSVFKGVFKLGFWSGLLIVVVVIGLVIWLISSLMKKS